MKDLNLFVQETKLRWNGPPYSDTYFESYIYVPFTDEIFWLRVSMANKDWMFLL